MRNLSIILSCLVLLSCQRAAETYTIVGQVADINCNGKSVILQKITAQSRIDIDTTYIADQHFTFGGNIDSVAIYNIVIQADLPIECEFVMEKGHITIEVDSNYYTQVGGTPLNVSWQAYQTSLNDYYKENKQLESLYQTAIKQKKPLDKIYAKADTLAERLSRFQTNTIRANSSNVVGVYLIAELYRRLPIKFIEEIVPAMLKQYPKHPSLLMLTDRVAYAKKSQIGNPYIDFEAKQTNGNSIKLSQYVGTSSYILIDFWASWCAPCRREMATLKRVYDTYHTKGLEIIGVSLDQDEHSWKSCIGELHLTWPQLSNLRGFDDPCVTYYAIEGIPHIILLDQQGTIIAKDLRGKELELKMQELLGK